MSRTEELYHQIRRRLLQVQRAELLVRLGERAASAAIAILWLLVGAIVLEMLLQGNSAFRAVLWHSWLAATAGALLWAIVPALARWTGIVPTPPLEKLALRVGQRYPQIGDALCNVLQLMAGQGQQRGVSRELVLAAFEQVAQRAQQVDFAAIIDKRPLRRRLLWLLGSLVPVLLLTVGLPSGSAALYRLRHWERSFVPPPPFELSLEERYLRVVRGEPVQLRVRATGIPPAEVLLRVIPSQGQEQQYELRADTPGSYQLLLPAAQTDFRFLALARWHGEFVRSPEGYVQVLERPILRSLRGEIRPPAYTRLQPSAFDERTTEIAAVYGSQILLQVESNKPLAAAQVLFLRTEGERTDTLRYRLQVNGAKAMGSFRLNSSGVYSVLLTDSAGYTNADPLRYRVIALEDAPPSIRLLEPATDAQLGEQALLPIRVEISDDHGFSRLLLHYRLVYSRYVPPQERFQSVPVPFLPDAPVQEVPYIWDLTRVGISPEDRYEFFLEVWDNDAVRGPKAARTPIRSVQLPGIEQIVRDAEREQNLATEELREALRQLDELRRRSEELQRRTPTPSVRQGQPAWEQQQQLRQLEQQQQALQQRLEQIQQRLEQMTERLERAQAISPETLQKYRELQQLLRQLNSPELQRALERLQQALQQMSPEQWRQALQNFRFNEQEFRAALERTLSILRRLQAEQKLDAFRQRLQQLAQQQEQLTERSGQARQEAEQENLARQQEALHAEWRELQQEWSQLEQLLQQALRQELSAEALAQASQAMQSPQLGQELQQAASQLRQGQSGAAQQLQRRAHGRMQQAAAAVEQLWQQLQTQLSRAVQRQLQKALLDALELSQQQEQLRTRTEQMPVGSQRLAELARQQEGLRSALAAVTERVSEVGQKSLVISPQLLRELGLALRAMGTAMTQLAERMPAPATSAQQQAMEALNRAVLQMQDALSTMQGGSSACPNPGMSAGGAGFLERLQQLALQQQGIAQGLQELLQGRLTMEQQAQLARLAMQQAQVQQALQELAQQQPPQGTRLLGDLRRIAEEMRELVQELRSGQLSMETLRRQHRILSRMLDALRSVYERDYEPERESRPGQDIVRPSPPGLRPEQLHLHPVQQRLQQLQNAYSPDYQRLIQRYFELLRQAGY
jgi:hypothetical protein